MFENVALNILWYVLNTGKVSALFEYWLVLNSKKEQIFWKKTQASIKCTLQLQQLGLESWNFLSKYQVQLDMRVRQVETKD